MTPPSRTPAALKEWDTQCQALAQGQTALILRKGGIMETHDGFEVEHREFYLYPTFLHQNPAELRPGYLPLLRPDPAAGHIVLSARAEVLDVYKIESLDKALALEDLQALNAQAIERRFHYRARPWLHALVLRVVALTPLVLPETPQMLGCVSWVPLEQWPASPELAAPAMPAQHLEAVRAQVRLCVTS